MEQELLRNTVVKQCAEKYDVYAKYIGFGDYILKGVKKCKKKDIVTPEYRFCNGNAGINLMNCIETQLKEIMMLVVANNYPKDGFSKRETFLIFLMQKRSKIVLRLMKLLIVVLNKMETLRFLQNF